MHLDRHDNEFTLRLDGGGGRREVTALLGQNWEDAGDPMAVLVGNKSFLGMSRARNTGKWAERKGATLQIQPTIKDLINF